MIYAAAEWILNQTVFASLLVLFGAYTVMVPQRQSTPALLIFAAAYFSTQIPLIAGAEIAIQDRYVLQVITNAITVLGYTTVADRPAIKWAARNEALLAFLNVAWLFNLSLAGWGVMAQWHPWFHWAIISTINYVSLLLLLYNAWSVNRERRTILEPNSSGQNIDHFLANCPHVGKTRGHG